MIGWIPDFTEVQKPQDKKDEKEFPMMIEFSDPNDKKEILGKNTNTLRVNSRKLVFSMQGPSINEN